MMVLHTSKIAALFIADVMQHNKFVYWLNNVALRSSSNIKFQYLAACCLLLDETRFYIVKSIAKGVNSSVIFRRSMTKHLNACVFGKLVTVYS